jgi:hypothetical protein
MSMYDNPSRGLEEHDEGGADFAFVNISFIGVTHLWNL